MASLLKMLTPVTVRAARAGGRIGRRMAAQGKGLRATGARGGKMGAKMAALPRVRQGRMIKRGLGLAGLGGYVGYRYKKKAA